MSQEENMIRKYLLVILLGGESEIPHTGPARVR